MSVTKTITTSKPFYVVAGAGDLAVKTLREGTDRLTSIRIERKDVEATISTLQNETKALPAKAQTVAVTLAADVAGAVGTSYDELLGRGRSVVTRIRRQKASQDLKAQSSTTVRRGKKSDIHTIRNSLLVPLVFSELFSGMISEFRKIT